MGYPLKGELSWVQGLRGQQAGEGVLPGLAAPSTPEPPVCLPWPSFFLSGSTFATCPSGLHTSQLPPEPLCWPPKLWKVQDSVPGSLPSHLYLLPPWLGYDPPTGNSHTSGAGTAALGSAAGPSHQQVSPTEHTGKLLILLHQPISCGQATLPHTSGTS